MKHDKFTVGPRVSKSGRLVGLVDLVITVECTYKAIQSESGSVAVSA